MKMTWYSTCSLLLFLFTTNGKKRHTWMRTTSVTVMVVFFKSGILKVTWLQLCSKSLLSKKRSTLTTVLWKIPYSFLFYGHESTRVLNLHQNFGEHHWNGNRLKKESFAKRALGRTLHQNRNHVSLILYTSFSQTILVFKLPFFFLMTSTTIFRFVFWLTFDISLTWSLSSASTLFYRNSKVLMKLGVLFLKGFSFKTL